MLRSWGGVVDMSMDGSPIIDRTAISGLYFNGGWSYGGFKATPAAGVVLCPSHRHRTSRIPLQPPFVSTVSRAER